MAITTSKPASEGHESARIRHAAQTLGLSDSLAPKLLRRALLEWLEKEDFTTNDQEQVAIRVLACKANDLPCKDIPDRQFLAKSERAVRRDVQEFAAQFFDLSFPERHDRWESLFQRSSEFPIVRYRLEKLESALNTQMPAEDVRSTQTVRLARRVCQQFALGFTEEPWRRTALLDTIRQEFAPGKAAVDRLRTDYPDIAKLAPQLLDVLCGNLKPRLATQHQEVSVQLTGSRPRRQLTEREREQRRQTVRDRGIIVVLIVIVLQILIHIDWKDVGRDATPPRQKSELEYQRRRDELQRRVMRDILGGQEPGFRRRTIPPNDPPLHVPEPSEASFVDLNELADEPRRSRQTENGGDTGVPSTTSESRDLTGLPSMSTAPGPHAASPSNAMPSSQPDRLEESP